MGCKHAYYNYPALKNRGIGGFCKFHYPFGMWCWKEGQGYLCRIKKYEPEIAEIIEPETEPMAEPVIEPKVEIVEEADEVLPSQPRKRRRGKSIIR